MGKVESAVKLANSKAAKVSLLYLINSVTVMERDGSWIFCSPVERGGANVV